MTYTELLFKPGYAEARVKECKKNLLKNLGTDDLLGFGRGLICRRLQADPRSYITYGPYWWALKKVLIAHGAAPGTAMDEDVAAVYCGRTEEETLVLADDFKDRIYEENFPSGTRTFTLDAEADDYRLWDPDYERLARMFDEIELF